LGGWGGGGKNLAKNCSFLGGRIIMQQEKTERIWTKILLSFLIQFDGLF
jgi:hypothetical protein